MRRTLALLLVVSVSASAFAGPAEEKQACITASEKAQNLRTDGKMIASRELLLVCARDVCPAIVRKDCTRWLSEVEEALPTVVVSAKDPDGHDLFAVKVTVDDKPFATKLDGKAQSLDPGPHVFKFEADGLPTITENVLVHEGEKNRLVVAQWPAAQTPKETKGPSPIAPEGPSERKIPTSAWIFGGVGVVGVVGFAVFGLSARSKFNDLDGSCAPACAKSDVDSVKTKALVADVSLGVGLVSLGVATYLFATAPMEPVPKTQVSIAPSPGGGMVQLVGRF